MKLTTQETERMIAKVSGEGGTDDSREPHFQQVSERDNEDQQKHDIEDWNPMEYAT